MIDPNEGIVRISQTLVLAMQFSRTVPRPICLEAAPRTPHGAPIARKRRARRAGGPHALPEATRAGLADEDGTGGRSFKTEQ